MNSSILLVIAVLVACVSASNVTMPLTKVPKCAGTNKNCWKQTAFGSGVTVVDYSVSAPKFPCTSGESATTMHFETTIEMKEQAQPCRLKCQGTGCEQKTSGLCTTASPDGLYIGVPCPQAAGSFMATGTALACKKGLGSYTVTLTCDNFEVVTYVSY